MYERVRLQYIMTEGDNLSKLLAGRALKSKGTTVKRERFGRVINIEQSGSQNINL